MSSSLSSVVFYHTNTLHKASNYVTMFEGPLPRWAYNRQYNNCNNQLCYTYSKGTQGQIYKPHSGYGAVGRTSAGSIACRRRL